MVRLVEPAEAPTLLFSDVFEWTGVEPPPRRWLIEGWLPIGEAALLTGAGAVGKSLLAQQLACTVAAGFRFMGLEVDPAKTIYITCEDGEDELRRRADAIAKSLDCSPRPRHCFVASWKGEADLELARETADGRLIPTPRFVALRQRVLSLGARFLVLDNTSHLMGGDENVKRQVAAFVNLMNGLAAEMDGVVLLLGHPNKGGINNPGASGNQFGGSVAWENQLRSRMYMEVDGDDPDARRLSNPKANYSAKGNSITFRWHQGAFVRDSDLRPEILADLAATARATADNQAFLDCLAERNRQRRAVSEHPSANYAPTQFAKMDEARGIGKERLVAAMDRLFRIGRIESAIVWRDTAKGRDVPGLREVPQTPTPNVPQTLSLYAPALVTQTPPNTLPNTKVFGRGPSGCAAPYHIEEGER